MYPVITGQWTKNAAQPVTPVAPVGSSGGGGNSSSKTYQITVEEAQNGEAEASAYRARNGVRITVTPAPFEGYVTESVSVQTSRGRSVETVKNADGTYSFRMPASDVTVRLLFAADSATDDNASGGGDVPKPDDTPNPGGVDRNPTGALPDEPSTGGDPDASGVSEWLIANEHPVYINGFSDGTFRPNDSITRAAACAIINRTLGREADREYVTAHGDELKSFSDVRDPNAWYYYNVLEAANEHTFKKSEGKEFWNQ